MAKLKKQLFAELKRWKLRAAGLGVMVLAVSVFAVVGVVAAKSGAFDWMAVQQDVASKIAESVVGEQEQDLGAVTSPYLPGPVFAVGLDQKFSVSIEMADATTTFAIATPFRASTSSASDVVLEDLGRYGLTAATTTVELVRMNFTSSTPTSYQVGCGGGVNKYVTSSLSVAVLNSDDTPTSWGGGMIENDLATAAGAEVGGGSVEKIRIGPTYPWIVCTVY